MKIESCTTWQCINSFAPWVSALGTILISGVSLWLSVKDKLIRLKAQFNTVDFPIDDPIINKRWAYSIIFTNLGARPVTITKYEWHFRLHPFGKKKRLWINPYGNPNFDSFSTKLPYQLTDGKSGQIFHDINIFRTLENGSDFLFAENPLIAFYRIATFNTFICTSIDKKVKAEINKGLRHQIWKQYRGISDLN